MNFRSKYFWFLILMVVGYGLFEYYRPVPIDWSATYINKDKIPFGTKVLYELLPDVFEKQNVQSLRIPIYNHLTDNKLPTKSNYIFICRDFEISKNDRKQLLNYVKKGNTVFISAYGFPDSLTKTLGFKAELKDPTLRDTALVMNFVNPTFAKKNGYVFKHDDGRNYFKITRSKQITILAKNARNEPIFLKINYGKGQFYVHNLPLSLSNFFVLDDKTSDFAFKSLSYLPKAPIFWDEYQKQGRFGEDEQSIFRYIMTQPPLQWAYYLTIFGLLLYAIFAGKRLQRTIPIIELPKNTSLEFVRTIGLMYFQKGDNLNIAKKKIQYLLAYIRDKYNLKTSVLDQEFIEMLSQKSGIDLIETEKLTYQVKQVEYENSFSEAALLHLNKKIEDFYQKTQ